MSQPSPTSQSPWAGSSMNFRQRLGYYLIGATFSTLLMVMYFYYMHKVRSEAKSEQQSRMQGMPLPQPGVPLKQP